MKKFLKLGLALFLTLGLAACTTTTAPEETTDPTATDMPEVAETCSVKIGLVTDTGGVDDKSFNQSAWEGLVRYAEENGFPVENGECIAFLQSESDADYVPNLSSFADRGYDLVMAVGYLFQEAVDTVAPNYPDTHFLFIDSVSDNANVMSAVYAAEHGSYLVGVAAGLEAMENDSNTVGFVGGMEGPLIGAFQAGFEQGVLAVNADATIYVDYADSFDDAAKGQALAAKQYDAGATVIFQAAGGAGNGVIKEAKERGDVYVIGVDKDQYEEGMLDDGTSVVLTSMIKRVDSSTYQAASELLAGTFAGGVKTFDLTNEGVGAEVTTGRNLTEDTIAMVNDYAMKIQSGEVVVSAEPTIANGASNK